jgi:hypothetical protein
MQRTVERGGKIMLRMLLIALGTAASASIAGAQSDQANRDRARAEVHGSYKPSSDQSVMMKLTRGNCGALAAGGIVAYLIGAPKELIATALTTKERGLARHAVEFACHRQGLDAKVSDQVAVRLIQVAQCHNTSAVDFIEHNQNYVRDALGEIGKCR